MTHGEAWYKQKQNIDLSKTKYAEAKNLPKRMEHSDAVKYYNTKLFAYWIEQLNDEISISRKSQIISLFMFGHTDRYELFKEKNELTDK